MKKTFIKTTVAFYFSALLFSSCLKNEIEEPTLIIDPIETLVGVWQETEKKIGDGEPELIKEGNQLRLWSFAGNADANHDGKINQAQHYEYNPENLGISVDKAGAISFENGLISFINLRNGVSMDTVAIVKYDHDEETLTIWDTTVTPDVAIKLVKIN